MTCLKGRILRGARMMFHTSKFWTFFVYIHLETKYANFQKCKQCAEIPFVKSRQNVFVMKSRNPGEPKLRLLASSQAAFAMIRKNTNIDLVNLYLRFKNYQAKLKIMWNLTIYVVFSDHVSSIQLTKKGMEHC